MKIILSVRLFHLQMPLIWNLCYIIIIYYFSWMISYFFSDFNYCIKWREHFLRGNFFTLLFFDLFSIYWSFLRTMFKLLGNLEFFTQILRLIFQNHVVWGDKNQLLNFWKNAHALKNHIINRFEFIDRDRKLLVWEILFSVLRAEVIILKIYC